MTYTEGVTFVYTVDDRGFPGKIAMTQLIQATNTDCNLAGAPTSSSSDTQLDNDVHYADAVVPSSTRLVDANGGLIDAPGKKLDGAHFTTLS